jgi:hypothetical protein
MAQMIIEKEGKKHRENGKEGTKVENTADRDLPHHRGRYKIERNDIEV